MSSKTDPRNKTFTSAKKAYRAWLGGRSYVAATAELRRSLAWRHRTNSRYAVRLIDRLEVEHCQHNGRENGFLKLTWRQMLEAGIGNDFINPTIAFVEALGLVTVTHKGSYRAGANSDPSMFQLNYLPWKHVPATGAPLYYAPNDEWAKYDGSAVLKSPRKKSVSCSTRMEQAATTRVEQSRTGKSPASAKMLHLLMLHPGGCTLLNFGYL